MDPKIEALLRGIEAENEISPVWIVGPETGELLHDLVLTQKPEVIVEVGTSVGYSALWMAAALEALGEGSLWTIESHAERFARAQDHFTESGLAHRVRQVKGHAPEVFYKELSKEPATFDFVFLDATKHEHPLYFEAIWPRLNSKGVLIIDNVHTHRFGQLEQFIKQLKERPDLSWEELEIGNGLLVVNKS